MVLRQKLRSTKMTKTDSVTSYLTKIAQVKDELADVGEAISEGQLFKIALNGFTQKWDGFIHGIVAREQFPHWRRMWDDFIQEKTKRIAKSSSQCSGGDEEENVSFASKRKKKAKKGSSSGDKQEKGKQKANVM